MDLSCCRVLVTPSSYARYDPRLRTELEARVGAVVYNPKDRPLTSKEVQELVGSCDGYIAGLDQIDRPAIEAATRLKVIARYGVGIDNVDIAAARKRDIVVTTTPGANASSVAELTIGLLLALGRQIVGAARATRTGDWPRLTGISIVGRTVGLIGLGAIGKQVALRLHGFGCQIVAHDPAPDVTFARQHNIELQPLDGVVRQADFVSLHLPLLPETRGLVDASFLERMKRGAFLINTARGGLVDHQTLLAALRDGHLAGAALDTLPEEPPPSDSPLLALPQVIVTPHIGAHSDQAANAMGWSALRDCLAVLAGEEPCHRVT